MTTCNMRHILLIIPALVLCFACGGRSIYYLPSGGKKITTGLENFCCDEAERYKGKKALLVTNHSGVDFDLKQNIHLLENRGLTVTLVMAPEHGLFGFQNEYSDESCTDDRALGAVIYNMHMLDEKQFRILALQTDVVIFDIQDMGMRCYTYITNLKFVMDSLRGTGLELIVLDRPDPIAFLGTDGAYLEEDCRSRFISAFPAPFLYDMTMGEAALYYRGEFAPDVKLRVIPMKSWNRSMHYPQTHLPWVPPSPNLPTYESSVVYAAVVLLEGINISLGRGTTKPFEYIGAPWIEPRTFTRQMQSLGFKNFRFRPVRFKPTFNKYTGEVCGGVQIFYTGGRFSASEFSYSVIAMIMENYPRASWTKGTNGVYDIDELAGTKKFRMMLDDKKNWSEFSRAIRPEVRKFDKKRRKYLLY